MADAMVCIYYTWNDLLPGDSTAGEANQSPVDSQVDASKHDGVTHPSEVGHDSFTMAQGTRLLKRINTPVAE